MVSERPNSEPSALWLAVFSKPRREVEAVEQLKRQGFAIFLPKVRSKRRLRGQWRDVVEPLFPRYLFLHAIPGQDDLRPVRSTRGVMGLVRFGGQLKPVPDNVMAELQRLCSGPDEVLELPASLVPGSRVRILEGPFADCEAELLSLDGDRRALVLLELLGRTNVMAIALDLLHPVD